MLHVTLVREETAGGSNSTSLFGTQMSPTFKMTWCRLRSCAVFLCVYCCHRMYFTHTHHVSSPVCSSVLCQEHSALHKRELPSAQEVIQYLLAVCFLCADSPSLLSQDVYLRRVASPTLVSAPCGWSPDFVPRHSAVVYGLVCLGPDFTNDMDRRCWMFDFYVVNIRDCYLCARCLNAAVCLLFLPWKVKYEWWWSFLERSCRTRG